MPHGTWDTPKVKNGFADGAITLSGRPSQTFWLLFFNPRSESRNPERACSLGLGCTRFARRYLGYLCLDFFSWRYIRCFNSLRVPRLPTSLGKRYLGSLLDGFPHSDTSGSTLRWQLTGFFRGLDRPSSPACPKASTSCPKSLITFHVLNRASQDPILLACASSKGPRTNSVDLTTFLFAYSQTSDDDELSRFSLTKKTHFDSGSLDSWKVVLVDFCIF